MQNKSFDADNYRPQSLCVLRLSALGDCISAFGLVCAMHEEDPNVDLAWVLDERFYSLFVPADLKKSSESENGGKPPFIKLDEHLTLYPVSLKQGVMQARRSLRQALGDKSFDCLFDIQTSLKASLLSTAIDANAKFGFDKERAREGQSFFTNVKVKSPQDPHVISGFLAFARSAGFKCDNPSWDFKLSSGEIAEARKLLEIEDDDESRRSQKIFLISPCASKAFKNWTIEGYVQSALYAQSLGFKVVLLGGPAPLEVETCQKIEAEVSKENRGLILNLCGKTSLRLLLSVVSQGSLLLCPDSGTLHIANALKVPVIGLFAIHDPNRVGPCNFKDLNVSVYEKLARSECKDKTLPWRYRVKNPRAMQEISFEMVKENIDLAAASYL